MADNYTNGVGVAAIRDWADGKFALDADLDTLAAEVAEIISEGGEPNVIETVKVNNQALTPDANKAVNIDLSGYAETADVPTDLSDLTNTGQDPYATQGYVDQNGGKIDVIKVNGTAQTITAKAVDITVPTAVSDLTNDSGFQTANDVSGAITTALANSGDPYTTESDVDSAISTAISSAYKYKGSVASQSALPSSGQTVGDVYNVQDTGMNYAWDGSAWDALGSTVDTSVFWTSTSGQTNSLTAYTYNEVMAILTQSA
ncbi:MAG: hypothetical protein IJ113_06105 [Eggerthellaceae bacterium]|nr:hypothetical protein [Eggerthellaceae bacterium]